MIYARFRGLWANCFARTGRMRFMFSFDITGPCPAGRAYQCCPYRISFGSVTTWHGMCLHPQGLSRRREGLNMRKIKIVTGVVAALITAAVPALADTLGDVKTRGHLKCGIDGGLPGFSAPNDKGQMAGIDADFCYALAAAIFGDKSKVK